MSITHIYVDMDGVICDFDKLANTLCLKYFNKPLSKASKREMWSAVSNFQKSGKGFWEELEQMSDAEKLMQYLTELSVDRNINLSILSAVGDKGFDANPQKLRWLAKHYPLVPSIHLVKSSVDKAAYAHNRAILIDDRNKSIDPWNKKGGIGILHRNVDTSLSELKSIFHFFDQ